MRIIDRSQQSWRAGIDKYSFSSAVWESEWEPCFLTGIRVHVSVKIPFLICLSNPLGSLFWLCICMLVYIIIQIVTTVVKDLYIEGSPDFIGLKMSVKVIRQYFMTGMEMRRSCSLGLVTDKQENVFFFAYFLKDVWYSKAQKMLKFTFDALIQQQLVQLLHTAEKHHPTTYVSLRYV